MPHIQHVVAAAVFDATEIVSGALSNYSSTYTDLRALFLYQSSDCVQAETDIASSLMSEELQLTC